MIHELLEKNNISHDFIIYNMVYRNGNSVLGEIDILGYDSNTNTLHLYEVKSRTTTNSVKKAVRQLSNAKKFFSEFGEVRTYLIFLDE